MKVNNESNKFVRFGMKVSYNEADYASKQSIPFGDPKAFLLEIIEPAGSGWINPLMSRRKDTAWGCRRVGCGVSSTTLFPEFSCIFFPSLSLFTPNMGSRAGPSFQI